MTDEALPILLWRESLARGPRVPAAADLDVWSRFLAREGHGRWSSVLDRCGHLLRGIAGTRFPTGRSGQWTIDAAFDELRILARRVGAHVTLQPRPRAGWSGRPDNKAGIGPDRRVGLPNDISVVVTAIEEGLAATRAVNDPDFLDALETTAALKDCFPSLDYRDWRHASLPMLVSVIGQIVVTDFALRAQDLWRGCYGSPELLRSAARMSHAGLGPYLSNVGSIVRSSRDIHDLARVAVEAAGDRAPPDACGAWIGLLSRALPDRTLVEVMDDLGDVSATQPLLHMVRIIASGLEAESRVPLLWRLRDIGLDIGHHQLAVTAQTAVVRVRPDNGTENLILGSVLAGAGEVVAAAGIFRKLIAKGERGAQERLDALRIGAFGPWHLDKGLTSPADRQATRLYRRGSAAAHAGRRGERIEAVDVR